MQLLGVLALVLGLVFRLNTLLVVIVAGFITGLAAHMTPLAILTAVGKAFVTNRYVSLFILVLPVIGVLERAGLRERAAMVITRARNATAGRIMILYMLFRQVTVALGLQLGGHPTFIRPIVAPMAEAAVAHGRPLPDGALDRIRGMAASSENYGNFFGQLMFIAAGGLLLIKGTLAAAGYQADLLTMAKYAIPTAVACAVISVIRFTLFDRTIAHAAAATETSAPGGPPSGLAAAGSQEKEGRTSEPAQTPRASTAPKAVS
jgi:uncharacterized membrane protein